MNFYPNISASTGGDDARRNVTDRDDTRQQATELDMSRHQYPDPSHKSSASISENDDHSGSIEHSHAQTTPNDVSGQDAAERDGSRHSANDRGASRTHIQSHSESDATSQMPSEVVSQTKSVATDTMRLDAENSPAAETIPADEPEWVDIEQAAHRLQHQGVPRTIRTIQRMCKREALICRLVPTENGVRYLVTESSIDEFVVKHNQTMPTGDGIASGTGIDMRETDPTLRRDHPSQFNAAENSATIDSGPSYSAHLREIVELKDDQINLLKGQLDTANNQIAVKDEQIITMLERDRETNILLQNLQNLVGQLPAPERSNSRQSPLDIYAHQRQDDDTSMSD